MSANTRRGPGPRRPRCRYGLVRRSRVRSGSEVLQPCQPQPTEPIRSQRPDLVSGRIRRVANCYGSEGCRYPGWRPRWSAPGPRNADYGRTRPYGDHDGRQILAQCRRRSTQVGRDAEDVRQSMRGSFQDRRQPAGLVAGSVTISPPMTPMGRGDCYTAGSGAPGRGSSVVGSGGGPVSARRCGAGW
jgi:hypothetical protein